MDREWNDRQPIYRQLRDRGVHMILDGVLKEGDPLPSRAQCRGRISGQSAHGSQGLSTTGRRGAGRDEARARHVRQSRRARSACCKANARKFLAEEWPQGSRKHSAARSDPERTRCRRDAAVPRPKGKRALNVMATIEARGLRKAFGTTIALDGVDLRVSKRVASSDSSVPTARARRPRSMRFSASPHMRDN